MQNIRFVKLNIQDDNELRLAATIHESAPLNWDPQYRVTTEQIENWIQIFRKIGERSSEWLMLAKPASGEVVGFHWLGLSEKHGQKCALINSLWVSDKVRKQGIGHELKRQGESWAREQGAKLMVTGVFYSNKNMIEFNLKSGFKATQVEMLKEL
jgi:GNAT superfamily N-acetyltransferase